MAVDSRSKRFSMMNFAHFGPSLSLFEADGAVDADDRAMLLGLYGGNALDSPVVVTGLQGRIITMTELANITKITGFVLGTVHG